MRDTCLRCGRHIGLIGRLLARLVPCHWLYKCAAGCPTCHGERWVPMRWSDGVVRRDERGRGYIDRCPDCNP